MTEHKEERAVGPAAAEEISVDSATVLSESEWHPHIKWRPKNISKSEMFGFISEWLWQEF